MLPDVFNNDVLAVRAFFNRKLLAVYMTVFRANGKLHGTYELLHEPQPVCHLIDMFKQHDIRFTEFIVAHENLALCNRRRMDFMLFADFAEINTVGMQVPVDSDNAEVPLQVLVWIVGQRSE